MTVFPLSYVANSSFFLGFCRTKDLSLIGIAVRLQPFLDFIERLNIHKYNIMDSIIFSQRAYEKKLILLRNYTSECNAHARICRSRTPWIRQDVSITLRIQHGQNSFSG